MFLMVMLSAIKLLAQVKTFWEIVCRNFSAIDKSFFTCLLFGRTLEKN